MLNLNGDSQVDNKKFREEGVFYLDEDLNLLEDADFSEDNAFESSGGFTNHCRFPNNDVFETLLSVNLSEKKTAEGTNLKSFLKKIVLTEV